MTTHMMADNPNGRADGDTFDVKASLRHISDSTWRYRKLVLLTCALTLGMVALYSYVWPPVYTAQAMLMTERDVDYARDSFYVGWNTFRKDDARTEIELMTAGPVLKQVVLQEKLTYDDVYHPFLSHLSYLWEKSTVGRSYRWVKRKIFPEEPGGPRPEELEIVRTVADMKGGIAIEPQGESNSALVFVKGPSRKVARIANTMMDVYMASRRERHVSEAKNSYEILEVEVARAEKDLEEIETRRLAFAQKHGLAFDFQKEILQLPKLTDLESDITASRVKIAALTASLAALNRQLEQSSKMVAAVVVGGSGTVREATKLKRLDLQAALVMARSRYREDSPEVRELKANLAQLDAMVAESSERVETGTTEGLSLIQQDLVTKRNAWQSELDGARAGLAVMERAAAGLARHLSAMPAMQTEMRVLDRELAAAQEKYHSLLGKRAQAAVSLSTIVNSTASIRVIEYAAPPAKKSWPKPLILYPAALVVGLLAGVVGALVLSYASGRLHRQHLEGARGRAALYGTVGVATGGRPLLVVTPRTLASGSSESRG